jgi:hypothetical protein
VSINCTTWPLVLVGAVPALRGVGLESLAAGESRNSEARLELIKMAMWQWMCL